MSRPSEPTARKPRHRASINPNAHLSPIKQGTASSTITIPLNDDAAEKARRLHKRNTLHDAQMNKIIAAATPRKQIDPTQATPGTRTASGGVNVVENGTPVKKVPLLANFEEWMKMATDNKINATNSWNFALIDYFHDMSLLKEGNSINFQKASCTLDGCVKIYTSRVDSVATETGKLLSGLADSSSKNKKGDVEGGDEDEDDEEGGAKKPKKRATRSEATLAKDFSSLQLKKFELEFAVDPLFKKASADFDEGGAKGLLLNHLSIDNNGRIIFDSNDDVDEAEEAAQDEEEAAEEDGEEEEEGDVTITPDKGSTTKLENDVPVKQEDIFIDIQALGFKFFPDLSIIDEQDICPSLKNFSLGDPSNTLDIPFIKALSEKEEEAQAEAAAANNFDDDDDVGGGFDIVGTGMGDETDMFGQGGEAWVNQTMPNAANMLMTPSKGLRSGNMDGDDMGDEGAFDVNGSDYVIRMGNREAEADDILAYFDEALKKNWAGPEHWRIRRIKDGVSTTREAPKPRKEKTPFTIDFSTPNPETDDPNQLFAVSNASINMPRTQIRAKNRNLLPDDKHFNSRQLLRLFLKPKALLRSRKAGQGASRTQDKIADEVVMDEQFWAQNEIAVTSSTYFFLSPLDAERRILTVMVGPEPAGNYDANFFHDDALPMGLPDDDDDNEDFADAHENMSPDGPIFDENGNPIVVTDATQNKTLEFGSQLVTSSRRVRPEYVQYARVAKKVDVRKLKESIWRGMEFESIDLPPQTPSRASLAPQQQQEQRQPSTPAGDLPDPHLPRKFTEVMNGLKTQYSKMAMADLSTSYCFISLLHLANEKGLIIQGDGSLMELSIVRDLEAEVGGEY